MRLRRIVAIEFGTWRFDEYYKVPSMPFGP
jgi:hypothetical protein